MVKKISFAIALIFIGIQFIPVEKTNPEEKAPIQVDDASMRSFLEVSCMDCHSNNTVWPWYASIAPVSWKIAEHVNEGREELNFSEWESYSDKKKIHKLEEMYEETQEGHMPEGNYELLHEGAEVTNEELIALKTWVDQEIASIQSKQPNATIPTDSLDIKQ